MRVFSAAIVCGLVVLLAARTGSARPVVHLVSPVLAFNASQRLECNVVNTDDVAHDVTIAFYDANGVVVSDFPPESVAAHGSAGISFPPGFGANHCEITADGQPKLYRGSIDVIDLTTPSQPVVVAALPMK